VGLVYALEKAEARSQQAQQVLQAFSLPRNQAQQVRQVSFQPAQPWNQAYQQPVSYQTLTLHLGISHQFQQSGASHQ
jgi:hypothetical protein